MSLRNGKDKEMVDFKQNKKVMMVIDLSQTYTSNFKFLCSG